MADWRLYSQPLAGAAAGQVRDELALLSGSYSDLLMGSGSATFSLPRRHPASTRLNLDTTNTVLVLTRDDTVLFAGPLLEVRRRGEELEVACEGLWNHVRRRVIRSAAGMTHGTLGVDQLVRFAGVDQLDIAADLIAHMQAVSGGDLGIVVGDYSPSGIVRDRTYEADKGKRVGEALEQLALVQDGFEWSLEVGGLAGAVVWTLRLGYPYRGRVTSYRFDFDDSLPGGASAGSSNVRDYDQTESSRDVVTRFTAIGPGEGPAQLVEHVSDASSLGTRPLLEGDGSWLDVTEAETLREHANRELAVNGDAVASIGLQVRVDVEPELGTYDLGDVVGVGITAPFSGAWGEVDGLYRIIGRSVTLERDGAVVGAIDLAELGRFGT